MSITTYIIPRKLKISSPPIDIVHLQKRRKIQLVNKRANTIHHKPFFYLSSIVLRSLETSLLIFTVDKYPVTKKNTLSTSSPSKAVSESHSILQP